VYCESADAQYQGLVENLINLTGLAIRLVYFGGKTVIKIYMVYTIFPLVFRRFWRSFTIVEKMFSVHTFQNGVLSLSSPSPQYLDTYFPVLECLYTIWIFTLESERKGNLKTTNSHAIRSRPATFFRRQKILNFLCVFDGSILVYSVYAGITGANRIK